MPIVKVNNISQFLTAIEKGIVQGLLEGAELLATNVGKETPVLTGRLRASIEPIGKVTKKGKQFSSGVESNVEYAQFIEFGTVKMKARGMFRKGADKSFKGIEALINRNLPKNNSDL